jgi:energy-coupling factor transporter ATP-binding protein EcfA2
MARYLERIEICDFRGFPGPDIQELELDGRHLLLYGENGSGKSSIFHAIAHLLDLSPSARPFNNNLSDPHCLKHRFTDPMLSSGRVSLTFIQGNGTAPIPDLTWHIGTDRPRSHPLFRPMARTRGCLDYRAVLRIHFVHEAAPGINLFPLLMEPLLREIEMPNSIVTFGHEWIVIQEEGVKYLDLLKKDPAAMDEFERQSYDLEVDSESEDSDEEAEISWEELWRQYLDGQLDKLRGKVAGFNRALAARIKEVEEIANRFVKKFDPLLCINLEYIIPLREPSLASEADWLNVPQLTLTATYSGYRLDHPAIVLNEARLSAIALAIYLAALKVQTPQAAGQSIDFPRMLVLDDVLIGLDMANRLPMLNLIEQEFAAQKWQVLLMTFDRAWYEVAKQRLDGKRWVFSELYAVRVGDYERPVLLKDRDHLDRALDFLSKGEVKAAAVHVRTEFELVLKRACEELNIRIRYRSNPKSLPASELWGALKSATFHFKPEMVSNLDSRGRSRTWQPKDQEVSYLPKDLVAQIEHSVSWVLNPLSHSETIDRYRKEIEDAIFAVAALRHRIEMAIGGELNELYRQYELLLRILKYRSEAGKSI